MDEELLPAPIYSALNKPNLILGGDRELMLILILVCSIMVFMAMTVFTTIFGVALWLAGASLLRMMAKSDPAMVQIYIKHLKYRPFYLAHSTPFASH